MIWGRWISKRHSPYWWRLKSINYPQQTCSSYSLCVDLSVQSDTNFFNVSELLVCGNSVETMCSNNNYEFGLFEDSDNHIEPLESNLSIEDIDSILSLSTWSSWNDTWKILQNTRYSQHGTWEMPYHDWREPNNLHQRVKYKW